MTITQLEYILALEKFRSFAKAAAYCHVTQPTLSMQVKKLEHDLGVLLFDRSKKPLIPTQAGTFVIKKAKNILHEARMIEDMAENLNGEKGTLRIGIIPTVASYLLPLFVRKFSKKYPEIKLSIKELFSVNLLEEIKNDDLDLGILATPLPISGFNEDPLYYEYFVGFFADEHQLLQKERIKPEDLCLSEMWNLNDGHCFKAQSLKICNEPVSGCGQNVSFSSGSFETIRRMVNEHNGFTLIPELSTHFLGIEELARVRSFESPAPVREISFVTQRKFSKSHLINKLKKEILSVIPAELKNQDRGTLIEVTF